MNVFQIPIFKNWLSPFVSLWVVCDQRNIYFTDFALTGNTILLKNIFFLFTNANVSMDVDNKLIEVGPTGSVW